MNRPKIPFLIRFTAWIVLFVFSFSHVPANAAPITVSTSSAISPHEWDLSKTALPKEMGTIEEIYQASSKSPAVVLVQNAHAVVETQKSIQKIIEYFQKHYGVSIIGAEGAASRLDAQIFKSFPDKNHLKEVFEGYLQKEELTGVAAAAIFSENSSIFQGVEDWELYEAGLGLYNAAIAKEGELLKKLEVRRKKLEEEKKKNYSKKLLALDKTLGAFQRNETDLVNVMKTLAAIQRPSSAIGLRPSASETLKAFLEEIENEGKDQAALEREVMHSAKRIEHSVQRTAARSALSTRRYAEFQAKKQQFQTSRISAPEFATYISSFCHPERSEGSPNRGSSPCGLRMTAKLSRLVENHKRLHNLEGTQLFKDFQTYTDSIKEKLFRNEEERKLDTETHELNLMEKLVKLEMSREEWNEYNVQRIASSGKIIEKEFKTPIAFYGNAENREKAFIKNLEKLWVLRNTPHTARYTLLVAGGFHTEGLKRQLKEKNLSYVVVMPQMGSVPKKTHYREHMKGNVSWKKYFEVENGKISVYKAFVRAVRDRLLGQSAERIEHSGKEGARYALNAMHSASILKSWRDQIIRDLAKQERLVDAGKYTRFLDELLEAEGRRPKTEEFSPFRHPPSAFSLEDAFQKIDAFVDQLRGLDAKDELTGKNLLKVLNSGTAESPAGPMILAPRDELLQTIFSTTQATPDFSQKSRFEARVKLGTRFTETIPVPDLHGFEAMAREIFNRGENLYLNHLAVTYGINLQTSRYQVAEILETIGFKSQTIPSELGPIYLNPRRLERNEARASERNFFDILNHPYARELITSWIQAYPNAGGDATDQELEELLEFLAKPTNRTGGYLNIVFQKFRFLEKMHARYKTNTQIRLDRPAYELPAVVGKETFLRPYVKGPNLLNIGAGMRLFEERSLNYNPEVQYAIGVDIEDQRKTPYKIPQGKTIQFKVMSEASQIPVIDEWADTAIATFVLHHVNIDTSIYLKEVMRVIKPGGRLIVLEDTFSNSMQSFYSQPEDETKNQKIQQLFSKLTDTDKVGFLHFVDWFVHNFVNRSRAPLVPGNYYSMEDWRRIFEQAGFNITEERYLGFSVLGSRNPVSRGLFILEKPFTLSSTASKRSPIRSEVRSAAQVIQEFLRKYPGHSKDAAPTLLAMAKSFGSPHNLQYVLKRFDELLIRKVLLPEDISLVARFSTNIHTEDDALADIEKMLTRHYVKGEIKQASLERQDLYTFLWPLVEIQEDRSIAIMGISQLLDAGLSKDEVKRMLKPIINRHYMEAGSFFSTLGFLFEKREINTEDVMQLLIPLLKIDPSFLEVGEDAIAGLLNTRTIGREKFVEFVAPFVKAARNSHLDLNYLLEQIVELLADWSPKDIHTYILPLAQAGRGQMGFVIRGLRKVMDEGILQKEDLLKFVLPIARVFGEYMAMALVNYEEDYDEETPQELRGYFVSREFRSFVERYRNDPVDIKVINHKLIAPLIQATIDSFDREIQKGESTKALQWREKWVRERDSLLGASPIVLNLILEFFRNDLGKERKIEVIRKLGAAQVDVARRALEAEFNIAEDLDIKNALDTALKNYKERPEGSRPEARAAALRQHRVRDNADQSAPVLQELPAFIKNVFHTPEFPIKSYAGHRILADYSLSENAAMQVIDRDTLASLYSSVKHKTVFEMNPQKFRVVLMESIPLSAENDRGKWDAFLLIFEDGVEDPKLMGRAVLQVPDPELEGQTSRDYVVNRADVFGDFRGNALMQRALTALLMIGSLSKWRSPVSLRIGSQNLYKRLMADSRIQYRPSDPARANIFSAKPEALAKYQSESHASISASAYPAVRSQRAETRVQEVANDEELARHLLAGNLIAKAENEFVKVVDPMRGNQEIDLRRLNDLSNYRDAAGFYYLLQDLILAHAQGFWRYVKKPQQGRPRTELLSPRGLYKKFEKDVKQRQAWNEPKLLMRIFFKGLELLQADQGKAKEEREYHGSEGLERLREALEVGSSQSVWSQLRNVKIENGKRVGDEFEWGKQPTLSEADTDKAMKLLQADQGKAKEEREYHGSKGLERLREALEVGSSQSVWSQLRNVKIENGKRVGDEFEWPSSYAIKVRPGEIRSEVRENLAAGFKRRDTRFVVAKDAKKSVHVGFDFSHFSAQFGSFLTQIVDFLNQSDLTLAKNPELTLHIFKPQDFIVREGGSSSDNDQTRPIFQYLREWLGSKVVPSWFHDLHFFIKNPTNQQMTADMNKNILAGNGNSVKNLLARAAARIMLQMLSMVRWIKSFLSGVRSGSYVIRRKIASVYIDHAAVSQIRPEKGRSEARATNRRGFLKTLGVLAAAVTTGVPVKIHEREADQVIVYVRETSFEQLNLLLKQMILLKDSIREPGTSATISDKVFNQESQALFNLLDIPQDAKEPELKGTFALALPRTLSSTFAENLVKALEKANIDTVAIVGNGQAADTVTRAAKSQGSKVRPVNKLEQLSETEIPIPIGILENLGSQIPEGLLPLLINRKDSDGAEISDPLVQEYAERLHLVTLVLTARILAAHPHPQSLLTQPELLKRELLKPEYLGKIFNESYAGILVPNPDGKGFTVSAFWAKTYLEARAEQRIQQSA